MSEINHPKDETKFGPRSQPWALNDPPSEPAPVSGWDAAHQLDIYLEAMRNIETAQGHARIGHFDSAALNCRMAAEKLQSIHNSREHPNPQTSHEPR